MNIKINQYMNP